jgi:hypothetical protein
LLRSFPSSFSSEADFLVVKPIFRLRSDLDFFCILIPTSWRSQISSCEVKKGRLRSSFSLQANNVTKFKVFNSKVLGLSFCDEVKFPTKKHTTP